MQWVSHLVAVQLACHMWCWSRTAENAHPQLLEHDAQDHRIQKFREGELRKMADKNMVCFFFSPCSHHFPNWPSHRYFSPYPSTESEAEATFALRSTPPPGVSSNFVGFSRRSIISHSRTSDLGLGYRQGGVGKSILWVCDRCLKYMTSGVSWERHKVLQIGSRTRFYALVDIYLLSCFPEAMPLDSTAWKEGLPARYSFNLGGRWLPRQGEKFESL